MPVEIEQRPTHTLIRVAGDVRLWNHPEREKDIFEKVIAEIEHDRKRRLVLNLKGIRYVDTRGICVFVRILARCVREGIDLQVVMPTGLAGDALRRIRIFETCVELPDEPAQAIGA